MATYTTRLKLGTTPFSVTFRAKDNSVVCALTVQATGAQNAKFEAFCEVAESLSEDDFDRVEVAAA